MNKLRVDFRPWFGAAALSLVVLSSSHAALIADSVADFSGIQSTGSWRYGYYNRSQDATPGYASSEFAQFDTFAGGAAWRRASDGDSNITGLFLRLSADSGHPLGIGPGAQNENIWAVRRYAAESGGPLQVSFDLHKENTNGSGGITGRIFHNGVEVFSQLIAGADGVGVQGSLVIAASIGDLIDFAIDPIGNPFGADNIASARSDGTIFSARIFTAPFSVPEPATLVLVGLGLYGLSFSRRKKK